VVAVDATLAAEETGDTPREDPRPEGDTPGPAPATVEDPRLVPLVATTADPEAKLRKTRCFAVEEKRKNERMSGSQRAIDLLDHFPHSFFAFSLPNEFHQFFSSLLLFLNYCSIHLSLYPHTHLRKARHIFMTQILYIIH